MIEPGTILQNRYRILRQIGEGGMGAVFVATDERFGSTVAIKETLLSDDKFRRAFEREAKLLNNLRHPALPRVSDHFEEDEGQFIVMEYISGEDLSEMMDRQKTAFPIKDVLNWADQLLDALDFLHTQEMPVIHRDIKPQNLKLTLRGQIILLDFGLAKGNPADSSHPTAAKSIFGYSRSYASLEQIQGTGTDPRSDLYSLAATLFHLATGVPPVDALTRAMAVLNERTDPLKPADEVHPQVGRAAADVLYRSMALNASHRPSSAVAMREMLRDASLDAGGSSDLLTGISVSTGLLTQNTEVMNSEGGNQNIQPSVFPQSLPAVAGATNVDSSVSALEQETFVRRQVEPRNTTASNGESEGISPAEQSKATRPNRVPVFAAVGLLLLVSGASALYVYQPALFSRSSRQTVSGSPSVENSVTTPESNSIVSTPDSSSLETKTESNSQTDTKRAQQKSVVRTPEDQGIADSRKPEVRSRKKIDPSERQDETDAADNSDETSDDGSGSSARPRHPKVPAGIPGLTAEQWRGLSPENRRGIQRALDLQKEIRKGRFPRPEKSPQDDDNEP
jgi:serine/threonine protein kinase